MPKVITAEQKEEVVSLRKGGMSVTDIKNKMKLGKSTVERIIRGSRTAGHGGRGVDNAELNDIQARIAELQQRAKDIISNTKGRQSLLTYVKARGMSRGDVKWVHDQLPKTRITRQQRLARAQTK